MLHKKDGTRNPRRDLMGWPEGKWPFGRHGHKWENIKGNLKNKGWSDMERINLAQDKYKWHTFVNRLNEISGYE